MPSEKSICISPVSNFLVNFLNKLPVRYQWYLKPFEKHQNKTIIFWKAPTINHTKIKHQHFDRKPPKYPDAKISYGISCEVDFHCPLPYETSNVNVEDLSGPTKTMKSSTVTM